MHAYVREICTNVDEVYYELKEMELSMECVGEANKNQLYKLCEIRCRIDDNSSFIL